LLRLHRAFKFVAVFIYDLSNLENHGRTGAIARESYNKTLAEYHPWYIRQSVSIAMCALPSREQMISKVFGEITDSEDNLKLISDMMVAFSQIAEECYNITQSLYEKHDLLNLP